MKEYKTFKYSIEVAKNLYKKLKFSRNSTLTLKYKNNTKNTWQMIKEIIGK